MPQVTQLAYELRKEGIDVSLEVLTEEEMSAEISRVMSVGRG